MKLVKDTAKRKGRKDVVEVILPGGQWYKLYNGDFSLKVLPNGIVITDPPYNQGYHYRVYDDRLSTPEYLALLRKVPKPCVIVHYPEESINTLPKVWGKVEEVVSWIYNSNTAKQSRLITWWGCKPDFRKYGQEYKNPKDRRVAKLIAEGKKNRLYDWWDISPVKNTSHEKVKGDVIHPCQTPEEVIRRIIATTVKKGQTIIDPFLGSGSVGKIAVEMGFNFIGYEIDPEYFKMAKKRIAACQPGAVHPGMGYWMSQQKAA